MAIVERELERGIDEVKTKAAGAADAADNKFQWATGTGATEKTYDDNDVQTRQLRDSPEVNRARGEFKNKQADEAAPGKDPNETTYTKFAANFGASEFIDATLALDATEHFLGSARVDIKANPDGTATYTVTNNTSFKSATYGLVPAWEKRELGPFVTPFGNMRQTYTWTEESRKCTDAPHVKGPNINWRAYKTGQAKLKTLFLLLPVPDRSNHIC